MSYSVLVVDDEDLTLRTVSRGLRQEGFEVFTAASGEDALTVFAEEKPDLTLLDIVLPGIDGVEVLRRLKETNPAAIILMMSAYHMVDRAVEAMKLGAYDYLIKPFHLADMIATLNRAGEMLALRVRVRDNVEQARGRYDFGKVVTHNEATSRMLEVARKAAESDHTTILLQGESGTGKSVFAKAIHYASPRASMPLLELNCAALPDTLLESELFGFEPGAFTDARRRKEGLLERADRGTLFLDEIATMSASVQAKLLRVLEESTFMRLGGTRPIKINVRLIAATNADLKDAVARGVFPRRPLLPSQRRPAFPAPAARAHRRHRPPRTRTHAALQPRAEKEVHRIYARRRRTPPAISLAGQHPRTQERDRAHHDPDVRRRHRRRLPARRNS